MQITGSEVCLIVFRSHFTFFSQRWNLLGVFGLPLVPLHPVSLWDIWLQISTNHWPKSSLASPYPTEITVILRSSCSIKPISDRLSRDGAAHDTWTSPDLRLCCPCGVHHWSRPWCAFEQWSRNRPYSDHTGNHGGYQDRSEARKRPSVHADTRKGIGQLNLHMCLQA